MGCCLKTTSAIAAEKAATAKEAAAALEAKKDLADPPIPVFFLLQNAAQGSDASKQHQLQVRRKDPTGEWKWRLLQLCVDAKQADPRYLPEELHLEFCSAAIAHTQCLEEHGVESDALLDVQLAEDVFTDRLPSIEKLCREIVSNIHVSKQSVMEEDELQVLVKHLDPAFINVPTSQIQIQDPKIKALIGKETKALVQYLSITYDENWIKVFHSFLGLGPKKAFPPSEPGVYEVSWEGAVRYRTKPNYQSIADEEQLALPQTQFEVREFIIGDDGLEYAYLFWARYFLPTRMHDGMPVLKRIGDPGTSEQLKTLIHDLFREIDTSGDEQAEWEEITSFLDGCEIAYDKPALKQDFVNSDVNGDGKLSLDEFIEAYKCGSIADIFCIPTRHRQKIPHHPSVQDRSTKPRSKYGSWVKARGTRDDRAAFDLGLQWSKSSLIDRSRPRAQRPPPV